MSIFKTNLDFEEIKKNPEELNRYLTSIYALEYYTYYSYGRAQKIERDFKSLDKKYKEKLALKPEERVQNLYDAIKLNQAYLSEIIKTHSPGNIYFQNMDKKKIEDVTYSEYTNINSSVLLYILRDWSAASKNERNKNYAPIIDEVKKYFQNSSKILVPGSAQCRLGYEIAKLGHFVECNEYNYTNVLMCDYFFNNAKQKDQFVLQPLVYSFLNYLKEDYAFQKFTFPDEDMDLEAIKRMYLNVGDFVKLYNKSDKKFDCIITCFFIDTARNVLEYLEIIDNLLNEGGIWINFGPLAYHWVWSYGLSIELPYDVLKDSIKNYGFEFLNEDTNIEIALAEREGFMKNEIFRCIFFTCRKNKK